MDRSTKKRRTKKIGRPILLLYQMYALISAAAIRLGGVKLKIDRSGIEDIEGPALVLCPHVSLKDHIFVANALLPKRPTFVLSEHFISKPIIGTVLKKFARVITKKMFCADAGTIMGIMRAKSEGNIIVLFPEGRLNAVAHSQPVAEGTAQLVKKLGIDVYSAVGNGSALVYPKWGEKPRRGVIDVKTSKVLSKEDIASLQVDEISAAIDKLIYHDDEAAAAGREYLCSDTAKGLDSVLYKCPQCHDEFTLTAGEGCITCKSCGFKTRLGYDYRFDNDVVKSVNDWFYWQRETFNTDEVLKDDIRIGAVNDKGIMDFDAGAGSIRLDRDRFWLKGSVFGNDIEFSRETKKIGGLPYTPMREFDIYYDKKLLYLMPQDGRRIIKYVNMVDLVCQKE